MHLGESFDYTVVYDNSCGLSQSTCDQLLDGVGEIISAIKDDSSRHSRVSVIEFTDHEARVVVRFEDAALQRDAAKLIHFVKHNGRCTGGGDGVTDTLEGVLAASAQYEDERRIRKLILINGCRDTEGDIHDFCGKYGGKMEFVDNRGIDVYVVNLVKISKAKNRIRSKGMAKKYALCLADNDCDRVCVAGGVSMADFDGVIEDCLLPKICMPPTQSGCFSTSKM